MEQVIMRMLSLITRKVFSDHIKASLFLHLQLSIPIERFTSPPEDSLPLLRLYFRSLVTGMLTHKWCPVLYVVAMSHVNSFIFSQDAAAQVLHTYILHLILPLYPSTHETMKVSPKCKLSALI